MNLFELVAFLRDEMKAPICFSKSRNSYIYEYVPLFYLGFEKDRMRSSELYGVYGGLDGNVDDNVCDDAPDDIIPDDINFNDLYLYDDYQCINHRI
ncbi:MAG: hypothetical protein LBP64_04985 [Tannerella sp.]|nr:hypothetical protein [Tannerella sp.]